MYDSLNCEQYATHTHSWMHAFLYLFFFLYIKSEKVDVILCICIYTKQCEEVKHVAGLGVPTYLYVYTHLLFY